MKPGSLLSLFTCFLFLMMNAQDEAKVFEKVEQNAYTNSKQWFDHIKKSIQLPDSILKDIPAGTYKVSVKFIVDIHGNIGQIKAKNDPGYGLSVKSEKIISSYKGKWIPANQCGRNVKSYEEETIVFVIPGASQ